MKLYYISEATIPSYSAYSNHVMKMSETLSKRFDFKLISLNQESNKLNKIKSVFKFYKVNFFHTAFLTIKKKSILNSLKFFLFIILNIDLFSKKIFISRSPFISLMLILFNFKTIVEVHHPFYNNTFSKIFFFFKNKKNFLKIIVITNNLKNYFIDKYNFPKEKIFIAPDCSDEKKYSFTQQKIKFSKRNIGYVGSFYEGRGLELIINIAKILKNFNFYLIGDASTIKFNNLIYPKNLHFLGFKSQSEITKFYNIFDIVIAPYQKNVKVFGNKTDTSKFMSPLKIFEYMSYKKVIISSNNKVLREVLKNNVNSFLCYSQNPREWSEQILKVYNNKKLKKKLLLEHFMILRINIRGKIELKKYLNK